uniref:hypothetical protein n=1 Tax=Thaumasiovibrio occultus TaxID=1891184 RepID=UPI000B35086F|nr:hypothetical protein [Thaumasiovibrio occultus]
MQYKQDFNVGGSVERALNGEVTLRPVAILEEGAKITVSSFFRTLPALIIFQVVFSLIWSIALQMQGVDSTIYQDQAWLSNPAQDMHAVVALQFAVLTCFILCSPLHAGLSLVAVANAVGVKTKPTHIFKGFAHVIPVIVLSVAQLFLLMVFNVFAVFLIMLLSMSFFLVCEKKVNPLLALAYSGKAIIRKFLSILLIHLVFLVGFIITLMATAFGFLVSSVVTLLFLAFYYNVSAIVYRELFGVTLQVIATGEKSKAEAQQAPSRQDESQERYRDASSSNDNTPHEDVKRSNEQTSDVEHSNDTAQSNDADNASNQEPRNEPPQPKTAPRESQVRNNDNNSGSFDA